MFQTDKIKLAKALEIAEKQVSVAEWASRAREATVRRIEADLHKAQTDYERFKRLYENDGAVTENALEAQESRYKQVLAALAEAKAAAGLALRQKEQAESNRAIAAKDLDDSLVRGRSTP